MLPLQKWFSAVLRDECDMIWSDIVIWNSLSLNMKMAPSLSSLKKLYFEEQYSTL